MPDRLAMRIARAKSAHDSALSGLLASAMANPVDTLTVKRFERAAQSVTATFIMVVDELVDAAADGETLPARQLLRAQMLNDVAQAKTKLFRFVVTPRTAILPSLKSSRMSDAKAVRVLLEKTLPISTR